MHQCKVVRCGNASRDRGWVSDRTPVSQQEPQIYYGCLPVLAETFDGIPSDIPCILRQHSPTPAPSTILPGMTYTSNWPEN